MSRQRRDYSFTLPVGGCRGMSSGVSSILPAIWSTRSPIYPLTEPLETPWKYRKLSLHKVEQGLLKARERNHSKEHLLELC